MSGVSLGLEEQSNGYGVVAINNLEMERSYPDEKNYFINQTLDGQKFGGGLPNLPEQNEEEISPVNKKMKSLKISAQ